MKKLTKVLEEEGALLAREVSSPPSGLKWYGGTSWLRRWRGGLVQFYAEYEGGPPSCYTLHPDGFGARVEVA